MPKGSYRIASHYDVNVDRDVDADDPWYYFLYDERWRIISTYRAPGSSPSSLDDDPKERFVYHNAGRSGYGSSSYIDDVILRDKDANTDWDEESDGVLEERRAGWLGGGVCGTACTSCGMCLLGGFYVGANCLAMCQHLICL